MREGDGYTDGSGGEVPYLNNLWDGWQARAALASAPAQPVAMTDEQIEPLLQSLCEAIKDELNDYRCTHIRDGEDGQRGYPLVDLLTLPGDKDIQRGYDEIEMIADAMYHAIKPALSRALSAQAAPVGYISPAQQSLIIDQARALLTKKD